VKKLIATIALLIFTTAVAYAAPTLDFVQGKATADITFRFSPDYTATVEGNFGNLSQDFNGDTHIEWGMIVGIDRNWAFQYRQANPKAKWGVPLDNYYPPTPQMAAAIYNPNNESSVTIESKFRQEEYNVLYKLDKNFALFTGLVRATPSLGVNATITGYPVNIAAQGEDKNIWHFGVLGMAPFADKFNAYGVASFGSDYRNWEVGIAYDVAKNIKLDVNYRDMKVDNMTLATIGSAVKSDSKYKGWGMGLTYSF
jgi:opacity protein-like surface antigen